MKFKKLIQANAIHPLVPSRAVKFYFNDFLRKIFNQNFNQNQKSNNVFSPYLVFDFDCHFDFDLKNLLELNSPVLAGARGWIVFASVILISFSSCNQPTNDTLNIATAANMQFAMEALVEAFEEESKIDCEIILSSSGKHTAQIKEGAPYDVFVSADMKFPNSLFENDLTHNKPSIYAFGKLVLWSTLENFKPSIKKLDDPEIKHIALANPKTAPYGVAAIELLQKLNLFESVKNKLVYGENISQTNQFITSQAAEIGFTAKSVVLSPRLKGKGTWIEFDNNFYQPIAQGIVILKNRPSQIEKAKQFHTFIFSKEGKDILKQYGYSLN